MEHLIGLNPKPSQKPPTPAPSHYLHLETTCRHAAEQVLTFSARLYLRPLHFDFLRIPATLHYKDLSQLRPWRNQGPLCFGQHVFRGLQLLRCGSLSPLATGPGLLPTTRGRDYVAKCCKRKQPENQKRKNKVLTEKPKTWVLGPALELLETLTLSKKRSRDVNIASTEMLSSKCNSNICIYIYTYVYYISIHTYIYLHIYIHTYIYKNK